MTINKITPADLDELRKLGSQTFYETFAWGNTEKNMQIYLDATFSEKNLDAEINNPHIEIYFARTNNQPVGYMKINLGPAQGEFRDENCLEIERLYVKKEYQEQGIGKMLLNKAFELARTLDLDFIWLGVWEKNEKAIAFYLRNGFSRCGEHIYWVGDDPQNDYLMKAAIVKENP